MLSVTVFNGNPSQSSCDAWGKAFKLDAAEPQWAENPTQWKNKHLAAIRALEAEIWSNAVDEDGDTLWLLVETDACGSIAHKITRPDNDE